MPMNPRLLVPRANITGIAIAKDNSGNVIQPVEYTADGEDYVAHIFNTSGTLQFFRAVEVEYLIVAGGGGGGRGVSATGVNRGGGGAGGVIKYVSGETNNDAAALMPVGIAPVTVGAGGPTGSGDNTDGLVGGDSVFAGKTAKGGGGGAGVFNGTGVSGGSGGGGANTSGVGGATLGGSQGNNGGNGNGDIAEIIIYNSALSDADRAAVEDYLIAKWGIT